jgi:dTDP-4-dehydrorhamnose reductase
MWLILGGHGQLGQSLQRSLESHSLQYTALGRQEVDISKMNEVSAVVKDVSPTVIVNAAAWTAVDAAEDNEDDAYAVNCLGAGRVAVAAAANSIPLVHISTDYVFSGTSPTPFREDDIPAPVGAYGRTKLAGENAVRLAHPEGSLIVRTAWLYSQFGHNFAKTMASRAMDQQPVRVVNDQRGQPTLATDLADHIIDLVAANAPAGTYHGTNSGECTWFEFASEIFRLVGVDPFLVSAVPSTEYPTRAIRPSYSVLAHGNTEHAQVAPMRPWLEALEMAMPHIVAQTKRHRPQ